MQRRSFETSIVPAEPPRKGGSALRFFPIKLSVTSVIQRLCVRTFNRYVFTFIWRILYCSLGLKLFYFNLIYTL